MALTDASQSGRHATMYSQLSKNVQEIDAQRFVDNVLQPKCDDRLLDFGCGTGNVTLHLANQLGPRALVVGVDQDEERIKIAQSRLDSYENVKMIHGSIDEAKRFAPYDVINSNHVLHWIPSEELDKYAQNFFDLLKAGGRFGFTTSETDIGFIRDLSASQYGNSYEAFLAAVGWTLPPLSFWERLFGSVGFEIVYSSKEERSIVFPNEEALLDWWEATCVGHFSAAQRTPEEILSKYGLKRDEPITVHFCLIYVVAKKPA